MFKIMPRTSHCMKKSDYLYNHKSEISNVCNEVEGHCLQAMKIVHRHNNGSLDWLISEYQSVNPSREAISILSGKYKRFKFVHLVMRSQLSCTKIFKVQIFTYYINYDKMLQLLVQQYMKQQNG